VEAIVDASAGFAEVAVISCPANDGTSGAVDKPIGASPALVVGLVGVVLVRGKCVSTGLDEGLGCVQQASGSCKSRGSGNTGCVRTRPIDKLAFAGSASIKHLAGVLLEHDAHVSTSLVEGFNGVGILVGIRMSSTSCDAGGAGPSLKKAPLFSGLVSAEPLSPSHPSFIDGLLDDFVITSRRIPTELGMTGIPGIPIKDG